MKYLLAFLFAFVALVSAAAVDHELAKFERDLDEVMAEGNIEIFSIAQDNNGLEKLVILVDGQLEGTIVQTDEFTSKYTPPDQRIAPLLSHATFNWDMRCP
jgi:hypothetical protein